jgi:cell division transport system permease protein
MTFLSCLTLGAVTLVRDTASVWESQISREATIQIKPAEGLDMEAALDDAPHASPANSPASAAPDRRSRGDRAAARTLARLGLNIDELPVPRLVIVTIDESSPPISARCASDRGRRCPNRLARRSPHLGRPPGGHGAHDGHHRHRRAGADAGSDGPVGGSSPRAAPWPATATSSRCCISSAPRRAFIAREFRHHFLSTGMKGAAAGGFAAVLVFLVVSFWSSRNLATPQADQATALFGNFAIGLNGYLGVALTVLVVGVLTAATSHVTVVSHLKDLEGRQTDSGS